MQTRLHPLPAAASGTRREVQSLHFGPVRAARKVYIQAALHADEIPGMLVCHYLQQMLTALDTSGALLSQVVLVPVANPVGLAQQIQGTAFGRFDLSTGLNFNRGYQHLTPALISELRPLLGKDAQENLHLIRRSAQRLLHEQAVTDETSALKRLLQSLAIDADVVLDLHCDHQAVLHLYCGTPLTEQTLRLAAHMQAQAVLTSKLPGDDPFDDSCSRHWWELRDLLGEQAEIPLACLSVTVELRGETDVSHVNAKQDAQGILNFLRESGHIATTAEELSRLHAVASPCAATPLEGVEPVTVPGCGVLVFLREPGQHVEVGEVIAELVDPLSGQVTPVGAGVSGLLFARIARRYVTTGTRIAKIAGSHAFRSGNLLSA